MKGLLLIPEDDYKAPLDNGLKKGKNKYWNDLVQDVKTTVNSL